MPWRMLYTNEGVLRCLKAGVRSIEHGNFMTEETMVKVAEHGAFFDPTFISVVQRVEMAGEMGLSGAIVDNLKRTIEKGKQVYSRAKRHQVPIALGTDLWGPGAQKSQLREFEVRREFNSAREILCSATVINADLLMQKGSLGTISAGAYADLLVVDGDPLVDLGILVDPQHKLKLIMKAGVIYKNAL